VMDFIDIVPVDTNRNRYESSDIEFSPCCVKVIMLLVLHLCIVILLRVILPFFVFSSMGTDFL